MAPEQRMSLAQFFAHHFFVTSEDSDQHRLQSLSMAKWLEESLVTSTGPKTPEEGLGFRGLEFVSGAGSGRVFGCLPLPPIV
jgi:hypothetical protein